MQQNTTEILPTDFKLLSRNGITTDYQLELTVKNRSWVILRKNRNFAADFLKNKISPNILKT